MDRREEKTCPECRGSGWRTVTDEQGYERKVRCDCYDEVLCRQLHHQARIPPRYASCHINNLLDKNSSIHKAKEIARRFVGTYPGSGRGLLLMGPTGVGKTHLAVFILEHLLEAQLVPCRFEEFRTLLQEIRSSYDPRSDRREEEILRPVMEVPLLLLDDLGAEKTTGWVLDTLMLIIDHRYNHRLMTIITTNFMDDPGLLRGDSARPFGSDRQEMRLSERIGDRLRSRLHEMCDTVHMMGRDHRSEMDEGARDPGGRKGREAR